MKFQTSAFTLVELLVVIFIIGLLASILVPALYSVFESGKSKSAIAEIKRLETSLSLYESSYRDYPPSTMDELGLKDNNKINGGNEALVLCLSGLSEGSSFYDFKEKDLGNTDSDISSISLKKLGKSTFATNELLELLDPWGNPYIYFHGKDLLRTTQFKYMINDDITNVSPYMKKTKTGRVKGAGKYQILSAGSDMKMVTKDDIVPD